MSTQHTPTPWKMVPVGATDEVFLIVAGSNKVVAQCAQTLKIGKPPTVAESKANAQYIVSAVNACASLGLTPEALDAGALKELVEAAQRASRSHHHPSCKHYGQIDRCTCHVGAAMKALAKFTTQKGQ